MMKFVSLLDLQAAFGKYNQPWFKTQTYLNPHPFELKLRNYY